MRNFLAFGFGLVPAGLVLGSWACSGDGSVATPPGSDASMDSGTAFDVLPFDDQLLMGPDTQGVHCQGFALSGMTGPNDIDPVELCTQDQVLQFILAPGGAYQNGKGVASSWSSVAPYAPGAGHTMEDDVALAAAIGAFHCGAVFYNDTGSSAAYDAKMPDLAAVLAGELGTTPAGYDGALYFHLRGAGAAFNTIQMNPDGARMHAVAEAYARAIQASYTAAATLPAPVAEAGAPETGSDAEADAAGEAGDGGAPEAGPVDAGGPVTVTLIGTPGSGGTVAYEPAKSIMAAAALLDLASLHAMDADAGTDVAAWIATATGTLQYTWARGRDPGTGLFYASLVTSGDPDHDQLGTAMPANDALLTAVQAPIVLAYARAYAAATALGLPSPPYAAWGSALVASMSTNPNLFDGLQMLPDAGVGVTPPPPPPAAFLEGYVPSLGLTLTNKPVAANGLILGGAVRVGAITASPLAYENSGLRWAVDEFAPAATPNYVTWGPNKNFLSVILDGTGNVVQQSYLAATSKDWHLAVTAPDAGPLPNATDYDTRAALSVIEGLTQIWTGVANAPPCVY